MKNQKKEEPDYTALLKPVGTKQETLEEAAENVEYYAFILGAKWQQEQYFKQYDSSLKLLQVLELVELALQNGSIHPGSFIIRNAVRECIGLEPIK